MRPLIAFLVTFAVLELTNAAAAGAQAFSTLVVVVAHPDDEIAAGPILARYAREGVRVHMLVVTDGAQGGSNTTIARGSELARVRESEAQCSAEALGLTSTVHLGYPDGKLGDYTEDPSRLFRLTQQLAEELQRLGPDAILTWGPDGGVGHPDHRLVSNLVTQLVRAGAPGVPERLFYMYLPVEGIRAINPQRGEPPMLLPLEKYFTVRVPYTAPDAEAAKRSMACHRTQYSDELIERTFPPMAQAWNGTIRLIAAFSPEPGTDLFR